MHENQSDRNNSNRDNGLTTQLTLLHDRGFQYGDGIFETIAIRYPGSFRQHPLYHYHLNRIQIGLTKLHFPAVDLSDIVQQIDTCMAARETDLSPWVLKLMITRGTGGRGYMPDLAVQPNVHLIPYPWPAYPNHYPTQGIAVDFSRVTLPIDPLLAGIKHLNRLTYVLAAIEYNIECNQEKHINAQEMLLCNPDGFVVEGLKSNLFIVKDGRVITPKLDRCGVAGVMRAWIIDTLSDFRVTVEEADITPDLLMHADEIFLCNSLILLWPVNRVAQKNMTEQPFQVGRISKLLLKRINHVFHQAA